MNRRKIFDKIKAHLLTQNAKAENSVGECQYLALYGLKCAIGCLIPDGHAAEGSDEGARVMLEQYPDIAELWDIGETDWPFLQLLQSIHDGYEPKYWPEELNEFEAANLP